MRTPARVRPCSNTGRIGPNGPFREHKGQNTIAKVYTSRYGVLMPTKKPRIAVTLPYHVGETYKRMAALQGRSAASVCADLLEAAHEPMCRTLAVLEAARDAPASVLAGIHDTALEMERELTGAYAGGLKQLDWLMHQVREPEGAEQPNPHNVIRGSGLQKRDPVHKKPAVPTPTKTPRKRSA